MLNNVEITNNINTNSILNKIEPTIKIISEIILIFLSVFLTNIKSHIIIFILLFILILLSKNSYRYYLKSLNQLKYFLISIFIINLFFINIIDNIINILRLIEILLYSKIIFYTTNISEMNNGITNICYPLKYLHFNPLFLSTSITLTIRFIPLILNEINLKLKALQVKGIYFEKNIKHNIQIIVRIIIPIFKNCIKKADNISYMMELKHFSFDKKRSNYFKHHLAIYDILYIVLFIAVGYILIRGEIL